MKRKLAPELQQEIRAIIEDMLQGYEFEIRSIKVDEVWSGDESNFVELWYQLNQHEFDPRLIGSGMSAVRSMLVDNEEERFPYINHHLPEGQKVKAA